MYNSMNKQYVHHVKKPCPALPQDRFAAWMHVAWLGLNNQHADARQPKCYVDRAQLSVGMLPSSPRLILGLGMLGSALAGDTSSRD